MYMRLENALTLTSIHAEGESELQEAMDTPWVEPDYPTRSGATSSGSLRTPAGSSQPVTGATSTVRTPPHHSAGKDPANEDDDNNPPGFRR